MFLPLMFPLPQYTSGNEPHDKYMDSVGGAEYYDRRVPDATALAGATMPAMSGTVDILLGTGAGPWM